MKNFYFNISRLNLQGSVSAWYIAAIRTKFCQELWMILDEKKNRHEIEK
jgi:hypothetical protein